MRRTVHRLTTIFSLALVVVGLWQLGGIMFGSSQFPRSFAQAGTKPIGVWTVEQPALNAAGQIVTSTFTGVSLLGGCCDSWLVGDEGVIVTNIQTTADLTTTTSAVGQVIPLLDVAMESPDLGMAVGEGGAVLLYNRANAARPWSLLNGLGNACPVTNVNAVVARGNGAFAVAAGNCVANYDNAAAAWTPLISGQPGGVTFRDLAVGQGFLWAAGDNDGLGTVVRLADGSNTPEAAENVPSGAGPISGLALTDTDAYAVGTGSDGKGRLFKRTGANWQVVATEENVTLTDIAFGKGAFDAADAWVGWAVGWNSDGRGIGLKIGRDGNLDTPATITIGDSGKLYAIGAYTADDFIAVGERGRVAHFQAWLNPTPTPTATPTLTPTPAPTATPEAGPGTWTTLAGPSTMPDLAVVDFMTRADGMQSAAVIGHYYTGNGTLTDQLLRYEESGWSTIASSPQATLNSEFAALTLDGCCVSFSAGGSAAGGGVIGQQSSSIGSLATWTTQQPLVAIAGPVGRTVFAAGTTSIYSLLPAVGQTPAVAVNSDGSSFVAMDRTPDNHIWAVTVNGGFARYSAGSWQFSGTALSSATLTGVAAFDANSAVASGDDLYLLSTNGSSVLLSAADLADKGIAHLNGVDILAGVTSGVTGWAVGTSNEGTAALLVAQGDPRVTGSWTPVQTQVGWGPLRGVRMASADAAWAVGDGSTVLTWSSTTGGPVTPTPGPTATPSSVYWAAADTQPKANDAAPPYRLAAVNVLQETITGGTAGSVVVGGDQSGLWIHDSATPADWDHYPSPFEGSPDARRRADDISSNGLIVQSLPGFLYSLNDPTQPGFITGLTNPRLEAISENASLQGLVVGTSQGSPTVARAAKLTATGGEKVTDPPDTIGPPVDVAVLNSGESWIIGNKAAAYSGNLGASWIALNPLVSDGGMMSLDMGASGTGFAGGANWTWPSALGTDNTVGNNLATLQQVGLGTNGALPGVAVADLDGDGRDDLIDIQSVNGVYLWRVLRNIGRQSGQLTFADASTAIASISTSTNLPYGPTNSPYVWGDFDANGKDDWLYFVFNQGAGNGYTGWVSALATGYPTYRADLIVDIEFEGIPAGSDPFIRTVWPDSSGLGNDATCSDSKCPGWATLQGGDPQVWVPFFLGQNHVDVPNISLANRSFTLSTKIYRTKVGEDALIISQGKSAENEGLQFGFRSNNTFVCGFYDNELNTDEAYGQLNTVEHWACTYDALTKKRTIYRNGEFVTSNIAPANYQYTGSNELRIGGRWDGSWWYHGSISQAKIYGRALTQAEVAALHSGDFYSGGTWPDGTYLDSIGTRSVANNLSTVPLFSGVRIWAGDFNGDSRDDLVFSTQSQTLDIRLSQGVNGGALNFSQVSHNLPSGISSSNVAVGDFDGDGLDDIYLGGGGTVYRSSGVSGGTLNFVSVVPKFGKDSLGSPITAADFDGDGRDDLWYSSSTPNVSHIELSQGYIEGMLTFAGMDVSGVLGNWTPGQIVGQSVTGDWEGSDRHGFATLNGSTWSTSLVEDVTNASSRPLAVQLAGLVAGEIDVPANLPGGRILSIGVVDDDEFWAGLDNGGLLHYRGRGITDPATICTTYGDDKAWALCEPTGLIGDEGDAVVDLVIRGPEDGWAVTSDGRVLRLARRAGTPPSPPPPSVKLNGVNGESFLIGIPVDVSFSADVTWNGNLPGTVEYSLDNQTWSTMTGDPRFGGIVTLNTVNNFPHLSGNTTITTTIQEIYARATSKVGAVSTSANLGLQFTACSSDDNPAAASSCTGMTGAPADGTVTYANNPADSGAPKPASAPTMPSWLPMVGGKPLGIPDQSVGAQAVLNGDLPSRVYPSAYDESSDVYFLDLPADVLQELSALSWEDAPEVAVTVSNDGIAIQVTYGTESKCNIETGCPDPDAEDEEESGPTVEVKADGITVKPFLQGNLNFNFAQFKKWSGTGDLTVGLVFEKSFPTNLAIAMGPEANLAVNDACELVHMNCAILNLTVAPKFAITMKYDLIPNFRPDSFTGLLSIGVDIKFGVQSKVATFEIYAGGSPAGTLDFVADDFEFDKFEIPLYAGFEVKLFFYKQKFQAGYTYCTGPACTSQLSLVAAAGAPTIGDAAAALPWTIVRAPAPVTAVALIGDEPPDGLPQPLTDDNGTSTQLQDGGYPYPDTTLALGPGETELVAWVYDDPNDPDGTSLEISTRYFNGSAWQNSTLLTNDAQPDMSPELVFDKNGKGVAMWQKQYTGAAPPDGPTQDFTQQLEVMYATFDPGSQSWSGEQLLTDPNANRMENPAGLSTSTDGVTAGYWLSGAGAGDMDALATQDRAEWRRWDGSSWGPTETILDQPNLAEISLDLFTQKQGLAAAIWNTGEVSGTLGNELFYATWNGSVWSGWTRLTYDCGQDSRVQVFHDRQGNPIITWLQGVRLVTYRPGIDTFPREVPSADDPGVLAYSGAMSPAGNIALLWTERQSQGLYLDDFLYDTTDQPQDNGDNGAAVWTYTATGEAQYLVADSAITLETLGSGVASSAITRSLGTAKKTEEGLVLQARVSGASLHTFDLAIFSQASGNGARLSFRDGTNGGFRYCTTAYGACGAAIAGGENPQANTLYTLRIVADADNSYVLSVYGPDGALVGTQSIAGGPAYGELDTILLLAGNDAANTPRANYAVQYAYLGPPDEAPALSANSGPGYDVGYTVYDAAYGDWSVAKVIDNGFDADVYMEPLFEDDGTLKFVYVRQELDFVDVEDVPIYVPDTNLATGASTMRLAATDTIPNVLQPGDDTDIYHNTLDLTADLVMAAPTIDPPDAKPGDTVQVTAYLSNAGDLTAAGGTVVLYADVPDEAPVNAIAAVPVEKFLGNESRQVTLDWTIPADAVGPLTITSSYVPEMAVGAAQLRDDNDTAATQILLPDLRVGGLKVLNDNHDSAVVQFTVQNAGSAPSQPARVEVRAEWNRYEKVHEFAVPTLAPGAHQSYIARVNVPDGVTSRNYDIQAVVIPAAGEEHAFGLNNVEVTSYRVGSDLVLGDRTLAAILNEETQTIQVRGTVRNNGHVSSMTPTTLQIAGGPLVGLGAVPPLLTIDIPVLLPGETYDFVTQITIAMSNPLPDLLFARVDPGNVVAEHDMLNNIAMVNVRGEAQSPTALDEDEEPQAPIPTVPRMDHNVFLPLAAK